MPAHRLLCLRTCGHGSLSSPQPTIRQRDDRQGRRDCLGATASKRVRMTIQCFHNLDFFLKRRAHTHKHAHA